MLWESLLPPSQMGNPARMIISADDYELTFGDGNKAICLTSGLWNVNFGYGNKYIENRIKRVYPKIHYATLFRHSHPGAHEVAERLLGKIGWVDGAVVFSTSGSALNDAIVKLALQRAALVGKGNAKTVVSVIGSYHGMTINSMQISGENLNQTMYGARSPRYIHLPADDPEQWEKFFVERGSTVALVILEPLRGTGAFPLSLEVLDVIFRAWERHNFLVCSDEVAVGFYRLGKLAASLGWPESPDVIGFSKGLTNGTEASALMVISPSVAGEFVRTDSTFVHGETQAGSPMATAAILGVLDFLDAVDIEAIYKQLSTVVDSDLQRIAGQYDCELRGQGLFRFLGVPKSLLNEVKGDLPALKLHDHFLSHGISVQPSAEAGIQLVPPITLPMGIWKEAARRLENGIRDLVQMGEL
ncbi:hypothetical protein GCM10007377_12840 [Galliscardovia ingluviei]|uniref:Aspartate aminotransferase family protein n=1 Tax=Galliscardovia ingluviei TaxID=1769422 RepID=A0A8J3AQ16_9BIFI|nr:aminotransferase class III-fold pyridoxal phosphate-dependent enzyme [Galliscardovia ingluviei]GGI14822.1 hypothetical protein GCM10007377_12840 [Galliscardovia ingluviei]